MGLFTRDCYDEDADARIAEIGKEAYDKEVAEYAKKYKEDHPGEFRYSATEPKVMHGDVICSGIDKDGMAINESFVKEVDESGEIIVTFLDRRIDGQPTKWEGPYKKICSARSEHPLSSAQFLIFDVSDYKEPEKPPKQPQGEPARTGKKLWEVWIEGFAATGQSGSAQRLTRDNEETLWEGDTFTEACRDALKCLNWGTDSYDPGRNTYWACRFFDNEQDARKSFG